MSRHTSVADRATGTTTSYPPLQSRCHTVPILEKVPGRITPARSAAATVVVTVQRFMGVLVHPVPSQEMQEKCGVVRDGGKMYLDWPKDLPAWFEVEAGDRLEVEDRAFEILGLDDVPVVYSELYVCET